jgi:hypothetical protein
LAGQFPGQAERAEHEEQVHLADPEDVNLGETVMRFWLCGFRW